MAHKQLEDGRVVVDWETGDPEGDRKHLMQAYTDFINEIMNAMRGGGGSCEEAVEEINNIFDKWKVSTGNQVDDFPRIWIERP